MLKRHIVLLGVVDWHGHKNVYCSSGYDCENLVIVNCEFFKSSQSIDSQSDLERILLYG